MSHEAIGAAIEVHREMGAGLMESIYERCMTVELDIRQLPWVNQERIRVHYKGVTFEDTLRFDILVDDHLLLELKSVEEILPVHKAQLLSYMKLLNIPVGLLINFHEELLKDGIHRMVLKGADHP